jgi:O-antigen/teichoic acid export membrane protein
MWLTSIAISIIIITSSSSLIEIIFGEKYLPSIEVLQIHSLTIIPVFIGSLSHLWLVNENKGLVVIWQTLCGVLSNIILNYYLIPIYGSIGAAISTTFSYFISAIFCNIFVCKKLLRIQLNALFFRYKSISC